MTSLKRERRRFVLPRVYDSSRIKEDGYQKRRPSLYKYRFEQLENGTIGVNNHKDSACHKEALQLVVVLPAYCLDVGEMLSKTHADQKDNRQCLLRYRQKLGSRPNKV